MATYIKIASVTVGAGGASTISFSSIPSTYTDLVMKTSLRTTNTDPAGFAVMALNGSSASFTSRGVGGNGSVTYSWTTPGNFFSETDTSVATANTFSSGEVYFPNYTGSTNKSFSADSAAEGNATAYQSALAAGLWSNTAAITSITLSSNVGNFQQYSTATLYGILKA